MNKIKFFLTLFLIAHQSILCFANGNGSLGVIYDLNKCGANYKAVSKKLGQRFSPAGVSQPASFVISGIPNCANIEKAYLWAEGSGDGAAQTATIAGPSGTQNFPMTVVGSGQDKCWGYVGSYTYRADVTSVVSGNGTYNISGILTNPPNSSNDMDGATLIVIYSDPTATYKGRIIIADGAIVVNGGVASYDMSYSAVCGNTTNATAFAGVGDLQATPTSVTLNGTAVAVSWDWWNYITTGTTVASGQTTSNFTVNTSGDCFNVAFAGLYYQTTSCTVCTPPNLTLNTSSTQATCSICNGTATVTATAPYGPNTFTYSWAPSGGNNAMATGLCAGNYTVTVSNGCLTSTATVVVGSTGGFTVNGTQNNVSCYGQCDGNATVTLTGGASPFTYTWLPSGGNSATANSLCAGTYTCNITDANGCTGSKTFNITQPAQLNASISAANTTLCYGDSTTINFSGTANATVTYNIGGPNQTIVLNAAGTASINTGPLYSAITYTLVNVQKGACTVALNGSVTITVNPLPVFTAGMPSNNGPLCSGNDLNLYAATTPASSGYSWTGPAFITPNGVQNPVVTNAQTSDGGTYTVVATDGNGCSVTGTTTVVINQTPSINIAAFANPSTCGGSEGAIVIAGMAANSSYSLYYSTPAAVNIAIVSDGGGQYVISGLMAGTYSNIYVVQNGCSSNTAGPVTLTDPTPPLITNTSYSSPTTCGGNEGSISLMGLQANTSYNVSYFDGNTIQNAVINSNGSGNVVIQGLQAGTYSNITVSINACTSPPAGPITLSDPSAPVITASSNSPVCEGQTLSLSSTVTVNGNPVVPASVSWTGPAFINPNGQQNPNVPNAIPAYSGTYTVVASYANCNSAPGTTNVTIYPAPAIPVITSNSPVCSDSDLIINVAPIPDAADYYWTGPNGYSIHQQNIIINGAQTNNGGTYNLAVTTIHNCSLLQPAYINVTVNQTPGTPIVQNVVYCQGEAANALIATASGNPSDIIKWYVQPTGGAGTTNAPMPSTAVAGTYTWYVSQETAAGCEGLRVPQTVIVKEKPPVPTVFTASHYCQGDSNLAPLIANGDSILWYTVPTGGVATDTAPTPVTDVPGTFTWYVSQTKDGCESDRLPVQVVITAKPPVPVTSPVVYCKGDSAIALTAIGQGTLKWYTVPLGGFASTSAPVPVTDSPYVRQWYVSQVIDGCESDRAPVEVTVLYRPTAAIFSSGNILCQNDTLTFIYNGDFHAGTTFAWTWPTGSTVLSGDNGGPYTVVFGGIGNMVVSVIATDSICSSVPAYDTVTVKQVPEVNIDLRNNIVCTGDPCYLEISWVDMEVQQYKWDFGGGHLATGENTATGIGPYYVTWDNEGSYIVRLDIDAKNGCSTKATDSVNVHSHPEAHINADINGLVCNGDEVVFSASVNNSKYTYQWKPATFFDYQYNSPVVKAHIDANAYVVLAVTNEYGCISMDSIKVDTKPCCDLLLPTAFSPNGDGKNDFFHILNPGGHKLSSFRVLNRFGQVVFETANEYTGWDGSYNGVAQELGVYYYQVKYLCDGKDTYLKGDVTLVR